MFLLFSYLDYQGDSSAVTLVVRSAAQSQKRPIGCIIDHFIEAQEHRGSQRGLDSRRWFPAGAFGQQGDGTGCICFDSLQVPVCCQVAPKGMDSGSSTSVSTLPSGSVYVPLRSQHLLHQRHFSTTAPISAIKILPTW